MAAAQHPDQHVSARGTTSPGRSLSRAGDGDLLRLAALACSVAHLPGLGGMATALGMANDAGAAALGLATKYGLREGCWAGLRGPDMQGATGAAEVLSRQPGRFMVLCGGAPPVMPSAFGVA